MSIRHGNHSSHCKALSPSASIGGGCATAKAKIQSTATTSWQYRLGAEIVNVGPAFAKLTAIPLRGGFFLDRQYFLDFKGNTVLNRGVSGGLGLVWTRLTLDFAYVYVFAPREPAARVEEIALGPGETGVSFEGFRQEPGEGKFSRHQVLVTAIVRFLPATSNERTAIGSVSRKSLEPHAIHRRPALRDAASSSNGAPH